MVTGFAVAPPMFVDACKSDGEALEKERPTLFRNKL